MTNSKKLDLVLENVLELEKKVTGLDQKVTGLDQKVSTLERDMLDVKSDLKRLHHDDTLILDEVERVHEILNAHRADKSIHTA